MAGHGGGGHGAGGALKEFFLALGLDADSAAFASAEAMMHALEHGLHLALEAAEKLADVFVETIEDTIEWGDQLEHTSAMLGQTTDALQAQQFMARIANVSNEEMQLGFVHLARSMSAARDGSEEAVKAYARLHVRVTDATGKLRDQNDVLADVAEGIRRLPTAADRSAVAMDIFGRSGARLVPLLMKGREGMKELREEAEALGLVLSEDQVEAAAEADESLKRLHAVVESVGHEFAGPFIEALNPVLTAVVAWVKANRALISVKVHEWAARLVDVLQRLASWMLMVANVIGFLIDNWRALLVAIVAITAAIVLNTLAVEGTTFAFIQAGIAAVYAAVTAAAAWLAAVWPIALVAAGIALLILAVDDFLTFMRGGDSVIGAALKGWLREFTRFFDLLDAVTPPWIKAMLQGMFGGVVDTALGVAGVPKTALPAPMQKAVREAMDSIPGGAMMYDRLFTGGGGTPASAANPFVPRFHQTNNVTIPIHAGPGANPKEIADEVGKKMHDFHESQMRKAFNAAQGG